MICYWRPGAHGLTKLSQIDGHFCSHILISFLTLDAYGGLPNQNDIGKKVENAAEFRYLNPDIEFFASIAAEVDEWSQLSANTSSRAIFAENLYNFLEKYDMNGIDMDWEFPRLEDKENFVLLLQDVKAKFGSTYSLSSAVTPGKYRINTSYDIPGIFETVDFVNLMTYNFHGSWETRTGLHSAMFRGSNDNSANNVDESVRHILDTYPGIDRNKIILGIPSYGRRWILDSIEENGIGAPASAHPIPTEPYRMICKNVLSGDYEYFWDDEQKTPYVISGKDWMSYDDLRSVTVKARYIIDNDLGGAMFWSLEQDDHEGLCEDGKFPLITTVSSII